MFEFQVTSHGTMTQEPDSKGLLHCETTCAILVQRVVVEDCGLRNISFVETGWTVMDASVRHADPVSALWTDTRTLIQRPDKSVAYDGSALDLDACVQLLLDLEVHHEQI